MKALLENLGEIGRKFLAAPVANKPAELVVLRPQGKERGSVAISYITWPFREGWDSPRARGHTNAFEVVAMAEAWRDLGFRVEVCDYDDRSFFPSADCVVAIDLHSNLERWENQLPSGCVKILHATGCHWRFQNEAESQRLQALKERRGVELAPRRQVAPTRAAEIADHIVVLGNNFTMDTFRWSGKPITRIPISSAYEFNWPNERDFETARRRFLWMGSYGMVHKGLDLVLEAFAALPDLQLTVCGRPEKEEDFFSEYRYELKQLPNICLRGWISLNSPEFEEIATSHAAVIYPSASEGGGGSVIHCMHAGLLPVCTPEASVETQGCGLELEAASVEAVKKAVQSVAFASAHDVATLAESARHSVRARHTRDNFKSSYRAFASRMAADFMKS